MKSLGAPESGLSRMADRVVASSFSRIRARLTERSDFSRDPNAKVAAAKAAPAVPGFIPGLLSGDKRLGLPGLEGLAV